MKRHIPIAGLICACLASPAVAQSPNCGKREMVVDRLAAKYSERLTAGGLQNSRSATTVLEVWSSAETGTFTVILTNAQGVSCIVASGTDWHAEIAPLTPEDTES